MTDAQLAYQRGQIATIAAEVSAFLTRADQNALEILDHIKCGHDLYALDAIIKCQAHILEAAECLKLCLQHHQQLQVTKAALHSIPDPP